MLYNFEWDQKKTQANKSKHQVTFEFATEIFLDPLHLSLFDQEHSDTEDRWISLGKTENGVVLVVVHTYTEHADHNVTIRIISARESTANERKQYEEC